MDQLNTIIWDWNGTLLNDVDVCIGSINMLLQKRNIPVLNKENYRKIFTFPVIDYYKQAGFDLSKESFDVLAHEFIDVYRRKLPGCGVFSEAGSVLEKFSGKGLKQYMISAMKHDFLLETVKQQQIFHYFEDISGIKDHYANGKSEMAQIFIREKGIDTKTAVFIGDTIHDAEVAEKLGIHCILVANGHQSYDRLLKTGCDVVNSLADLVLKIEKDLLPAKIPVNNHEAISS